MSPDWAAKPTTVPYAVFGDPQSLNLYVYVRNSPIVRVDADGDNWVGMNGFLREGDSAFSPEAVDGFDSSGEGAAGVAAFDPPSVPQLPPISRESAEISPGRPRCICGTDGHETADLHDWLRNGAGTQDVHEALSAPQSLQYNTVSGGVGASEWTIQWELTEKSQSGGWIVQHLRITVPEQAGGAHYNYWEAWSVPAGSQHTKYYPDPTDDNFHGPSGTRFNAQARFYEGLQLPPSFIPNNRATKARILPSTTVDPKLPLDNATSPVNRTYTEP